MISHRKIECPCGEVIPVQVRISGTDFGGANYFIHCPGCGRAHSDAFPIEIERSKLFLKCKVDGCGLDLKPPDSVKAAEDFSFGRLKGWCGYHDWQPLTHAEQESMMNLIDVTSTGVVPRP